MFHTLFVGHVVATGEVMLACSCGWEEAYGPSPTIEVLWAAKQAHLREQAEGPAIDTHRQ